MTSRIRNGCVAVGVLITVGLGAQGAPTTVAVPQRANANASIAAAGEFVALAWGASTESGATDVMAAVSRDGGGHFGAPVRVNAAAGDARLSGEQPARVAVIPAAGREPSVVIVWTSKGDKGTRLMTAR